jgi:hypothetical protein
MTLTRRPTVTGVAAFLGIAMIVVVVAACGGSNAKAYDIGPVFPLDPNKCARYGGDQKGSGPTASCMVTKAECEKAAADWRQAMQSSGVNDAIEFSCR